MCDGGCVTTAQVLLQIQRFDTLGAQLIVNGQKLSAKVVLGDSPIEIDSCCYLEIQIVMASSDTSHIRRLLCHCSAIVTGCSLWSWLNFLFAGFMHRPLLIRSRIDKAIPGRTCRNPVN
jgi:hypothetical protein